jgi:hypothetical protein
MSAKRYQRVNSSHNLKCEDIISEINSLVKKIKNGTATVKDLQICEKLTDVLQNVLKGFSDVDAFDRWVAKETIEMSRYTCKKYGSKPVNDKI